MTARVRIHGTASPEELGVIREKALVGYLLGEREAVWVGMLLEAIDGGLRE